MSKKYIINTMLIKCPENLNSLKEDEDMKEIKDIIDEKSVECDENLNPINEDEDMKENKDIIDNSTDEKPVECDKNLNPIKEDDDLKEIINIIDDSVDIEITNNNNFSKEPEFLNEKDKLKKTIIEDYTKKCKLLEEKYSRNIKSREKEEYIKNAGNIISELIKGYSKYDNVEECAICLNPEIKIEAEYGGSSIEFGRKLFTFNDVNGFCGCKIYYCAECILSLIKGYNNNQISFKCTLCGKILLLELFESEVKGLRGKKRDDIVKKINSNNILGKSFPFRFKPSRESNKIKVTNNNNPIHANGKMYRIVDSYGLNFRS